MKGRSVRDVALCGVMSALVLVLLLADLLVPTATVAWAASAGALVFLLSVEYGKFAALAVYVVTVILCGLFCGTADPVMFWLYTLIFGLYGTTKYLLDTLSRKPLQWVLKGSFALLSAGGYLFAWTLLFSQESTKALADKVGWLLLPAALVYFVLFVLYDVCLTRLAGMYERSIRKKIFPKR